MSTTNDTTIDTNTDTNIKKDFIAVSLSDIHRRLEKLETESKNISALLLKLNKDFREYEQLNTKIVEETTKNAELVFEYMKKNERSKFRFWF